MTAEDKRLAKRAEERRFKRRMFGIVEYGPDGSEDRYIYTGTIERSTSDGPERYIERDPNLVLQEEEQQRQWMSCEWPTRTEWRVGTCGRSAPYRGYGLALCWQHEDKAFDHVITHLERGAFYLGQLERLTEALLRQRRWGDEFIDDQQYRARTKAVSAIARKEVFSYLQDLLDESKFSYGTDSELQELLDELIQKRLQENWGATA